MVVKATAGPKPTLQWQHCAGGVERLMTAVLLTVAAAWTPAFPYLRVRPSEAEGCWRLFRERTRQDSWQGAMIYHRRLHVAGNLGCAPVRLASRRGEEKLVGARGRLSTS